MTLVEVVYYFCSLGCKKAFEKELKNFLASRPSANNFTNLKGD